MRLNGVMRLRIVFASLLFFASCILAAYTGWYYISKIDQYKLELSRAQECLVDRNNPCNRYSRPVSEIAIDLDTAEKEVPIVILSSLLIAAIPVALFWIFGSVVGWVYRGFKQNSENA